MARIAGVDLPREKRIEVALTYIFGIGPTTSKKLIASIGINPDTRVKNLSDEDAQKIRAELENNYKVEGDLRREISMNIKRLMDIGCYRGREPACRVGLGQTCARAVDGGLVERAGRTDQRGDEHAGAF